jgi:hypothetical protein
MEPDPGAPVGPGEPAVKVGMNDWQVRKAVQIGLDALPGVVGVNNHMGSRATRSRAEMDAVMAEVSAQGLIFLDSRTTRSSVAHVAASARGIPNLRNDLFLDVDTEDPVEIRRRLERLLQIARKRGWAVGIGHPHPNTIAVLEEFLPTVDPAEGTARARLTAADASVYLTGFPAGLRAAVVFVPHDWAAGSFRRGPGRGRLTHGRSDPMNRTLQIKLAIIVAAFLWSLWALWPTFQLAKPRA